MTNFQCQIKLCQISRDLRSGTYPNNILSRLSISDQKIDSIACGLRAPPGLDIGVEHGIQFNGSLFSCSPRWAGEPGKEQGDSGGAVLEGHEQLSNLLEISFILYQVAASGHTGGHDENELKRETRHRPQKPMLERRLTS